MAGQGAGRDLRPRVRLSEDDELGRIRRGEKLWNGNRETWRNAVLGTKALEYPERRIEDLEIPLDDVVVVIVALLLHSVSQPLLLSPRILRRLFPFLYLGPGSQPSPKRPASRSMRGKWAATKMRGGVPR